MASEIEQCVKGCGTGTLLGSIPWDKFTYSNCEPAAAFLGPWVKTGNINLPALVAFIKTLRPGYSEKMTPLFAMTWYACAARCEGPQAYSFLYERAKENCKSEVCAAMGWEGNPDIAGIGMIVVYVLEIILALMYLASFFISRRSLRITPSPHNPEKTNLQRLSSAFECSFGDFHDAATILCISIVIATISEIAARESRYRIAMSYLICLFTASIYFATLPIQLETRRRKKLRIGIAILVAILVFAVLVAPKNVPVSVDNEDMDPVVAWENECYLYSSGPSHYLGVLGVYLVGVLGFCIFWGIPFLFWLFGRDPAKIWGVRQLVQFPSRALTIGYMLLVSLVSLGLFLHLRQRLAKAGGGAADESQWSFGQILALATWLPTIIQFLYIFFGKKLRALAGLLPKSHKAVEVEHVDEGHAELLQHNPGN